MNADRERWAEAVLVEKSHGDAAPAFIAERIGALGAGRRRRRCAALARDRGALRSAARSAGAADELMQRRALVLIEAVALAGLVAWQAVGMLWSGARGVWALLAG
nr:hypothetical protein [Sphingomonas aracearum]